MPDNRDPFRYEALPNINAWAEAMNDLAPDLRKGKCYSLHFGHGEFYAFSGSL